MKSRFALILVVCLAFPASASAVKPQLLTVPPLETNAQTQTFDFTVASAIVYFCALDGVPVTPCTPPKSFTGLPEGEHKFDVWATYMDPGVPDCQDFGPPVGVICFPPIPMPADSETSSFVFRIDRTAPTIEFAGGRKQGSASRSRTANISFQMERNASYVCTFDKRTPEPCQAPIEWRNLSIGLHRLKVQGTDAAGNSGHSFSLEFAVNSKRITYRSIKKTTAKRCVKKKVRRAGKLRKRTTCKLVRF